MKANIKICLRFNNETLYSNAPQVFLISPHTMRELRNKDNKSNTKKRKLNRIYLPQNSLTAPTLLQCNSNMTSEHTMSTSENLFNEPAINTPELLNNFQFDINEINNELLLNNRIAEVSVITQTATENVIISPSRVDPLESMKNLWQNTEQLMWVEFKSLFLQTVQSMECNLRDELEPIEILLRNSQYMVTREAFFKYINHFNDTFGLPMLKRLAELNCFHGFIDNKTATNILLDSKKCGLYLCRCSSTHAGNFVFAVTVSDEMKKQINEDSSKQILEYKIKCDLNTGKCIFAKQELLIQEIPKRFPMIFKKPYNSYAYRDSNNFESQ